MVIEKENLGLNKSPIYNLSMCSLENFHTCFLKWLGENYPHEFLKLLLHKECPDNLNINFETQVRYSKDVILDLQIEIIDGKNTEYIVIENKLKSYPTTEQLLKYQDCFKDRNATFILLSLASNFELSDGWTYISYENLAESLSKITDFKNSYDEFLIKDYVNVVTALSNAFPKSSTEMYDFYEPNELDKIGLKDIYVKYRTSEFVDYIKQRLNRDDLYIGCSFHNKKGTIDIVKQLCTLGVNIGIQIEGNQYRHFMIIPDVENDLREKIAKEVADKGYWFNNTGKPDKSKIYKDFCGYAPTFIYRYFQINKYFNNLSYEEIIGQIEKDVKILDKYQYEIMRILVDKCLEEKDNFKAEIQSEIEEKLTQKVIN